MKMHNILKSMGVVLFSMKRVKKVIELSNYCLQSFI